MSFELGDVTTSDDPRLQAWRAAVQARGNVATVMPSGAYRGNLAERIVNNGRDRYVAPALLIGSYWYAPAPATIRAIYTAQGKANDAAQAAGGFVERVQGIPGGIVSDAGKLAREGVSAVTGIPSWAIPVLFIAGGAFIVTRLIPNIAGLLPKGR